MKDICGICGDNREGLITIHICEICHSCYSELVNETDELSIIHRTKEGAEDEDER